MQRSEIKNIYRLSPMQMNIYNSYIQDSSNEMYHQHISVTVSFQFDIKRLEEAFSSLVRKHDVLRTIFQTVKDTVLQVVLNQRKPSYYFVDLSKEPDKTIKAKEYLLRDKEVRFDLSKDNLIRLTVLKLDEDLYQLLWSFHHIILDGWSFSLLTEDLFQAYFGLSVPTEVSPPYNKFIQWLDGQDLQTSKRYWKQLLSDYDQPYSLSIPKLGAAADGFIVGEHRLRLSVDETKRISDYCKSKGISMHAFVTSAWGLLLCQYNNQNDVVFGSVVSGRSADLHRSNQMIGPMINTIPVRITFDPSESFDQIVSRTQLKLYESEPHSYYDLASIQAENCLSLDHVIVFENYPQMRGNLLKEQAIEIVDTEIRERIIYSFCLEVIPAESLLFIMLYNELLYRNDTVERLAQHLYQIICSIINSCSQPSKELSMITPEEQVEVTEYFNNPNTLHPINQSLYKYFESFALQNKENVALRFYDETLTYGNFLQRVDLLSRVLVQYGVKKNVCVGLMIPRSFELMVSIFAIWKAGGVYVPIDNSTPDVRKEAILNDCCAAVLLTTKDQSISQFSGTILFAEDLSTVVEGEFSSTEANESDNNDIAYIIYTSGSTGEPKGVAVSHISVINRIEFEKHKFPLNSSDVVMLKTTISFDVSIFELLSWIPSGASLSLLSPDGEKDPFVIMDTIRQHQVTSIHFVPSMFSAFLAFLEENHATSLEAIQSLRYVATSGEELLASHIKRFYALFDGSKEITLINKYGPTETTVDVSYYVCERTFDGGPVPIGKPMDNSRLYVLDKHHRIAPIDAFGELYISGVCLAAGYLNKPELTAEKYIYIDSLPGKRLYKTGDLVRWKSDGNIEFHGRMDRQVKVRGFRIELNEIESYIQFVRGVHDTHVICLTDMTKDQELYAYYTGTCSAEEIRRELVQFIPGYKIPRYIIKVDSMPYRSNGKVDKERLIQLNKNIKSSSMEKEEDIPRSTIEANILISWREIFDNPSLGMDDDFFELGGHSIIALRIANQVGNSNSIRLPVTEVLHSSTPRKLAAYVETAVKSTIEIIRAEPAGDYLVTPAQQRVYITEIKTNMNGRYNMPQAFIANGPLDVEHLKNSFLNVINRHDVLRSSFEIKKGMIRQIVHTELSPAFEVHAPIREEELDHFIETAIQPFRFTSPPLVRINVAPVIGKGALIFFDMHHIISDGISLGNFVKELAGFYNGSAVPYSFQQYQDYAQWLHIYLSDDRIREQQTFWEEIFRPELSVLNFPSKEIEQSRVGVSSGRTVLMKLDDNESHLIQNFIRGQSTTMFIFFMSVYHTLLSKMTDVEDVTVATAVTNRPHVSFQHTIGLFINTILIRSRPESNKKFESLLHEVAAFCTKAFQYAEYPYELLSSYIKRNNRGPAPLINTMLIMQNIEIEIPVFNGLEIIPYPVSHPVAKYDLQLEIFNVKGCIRFSLDYNSNMFSEEFILKLLQQFRSIALLVSKVPNIVISEIPLDADVL